MEFFTVSREKRPVRLSEATRAFARDSLNHVYGQDTAKTPGVPMDDISGFSALPRIDQDDLGIRRIAETAQEIYPVPEKAEILAFAAALKAEGVPVKCYGSELK